MARTTHNTYSFGRTNGSARHRATTNGTAIELPITTENSARDNRVGDGAKSAGCGPLSPMASPQRARDELALVASVTLR